MFIINQVFGTIQILDGVLSAVDKISIEKNTSFIVWFNESKRRVKIISLALLFAMNVREVVFTMNSS